MLELKLCGREEVEVAARLLIKAHAPTDATLQDVQDFYLPRLTGIFSHSLSSSDSSRVIILGMAPDGVVHAAYELPRIVQLDGILTLPRGYIATDPVNQGLGTEFFNGVTRLFEQVAFEIGQPVVHAPQASFRHTADFFLKRGYALIREEEGLPTATYHLKRRIMPVHHGLRRDETAIVSSIMQVSSLEPANRVPSR